MSAFNADDKSFLIGWFNTFKDQIKDIQDQIKDVRVHLDKTCDELHDLDDKVVKFGADLHNHLDNIQQTKADKKESKRQRRLNRKEIVAFGFGTVGSIVALVSVFG